MDSPHLTPQQNPKETKNPNKRRRFGWRRDARLGLRSLLTLTYPERRALGFGFLALLAGSGSLLLFPRAVQYIVDEALEKQRPEVLNQALGLMLLIFAVQSLAGALRYWIFAGAGERIVARLRKDLYTAILEQPMSFFDQRSTGELMSRLASDATLIQLAVTINISLFLRSLGAVIGGSVLLFYTSPWLTGGLLLALIPLALGSVRFGRFIRLVAREGQDAWGKTGSIAAEAIGAIRTVRAFAQEKFEARRYGESVDHAVALGRRRINGIALFMGLASYLGYGLIIGLFWYGGHQVLTGEMSVGSLTSFVLYALTISLAMGSLGSLWIEFMGALGAAERVFEVLDRKGNLTEGRALAAVEGRIAFRHVRFSYPQRPDLLVLSDFELSIGARELVALVGPSGSGKSTVASLLARFYEPQAGSIELDGVNIRELNSSWLRQQIGFVAQDPSLLEGSISANIRYGVDAASALEVERAARLANAHDFIQSFPEGYETLVGEHGIQLSGGQRQRIAIARALLKNPPLLILDEATSGLDAESEHLVQVALDRLMTGRTTLVIAHRLSTVRRAERIIVMERGQIQQAGSHDVLMKAPDGLYAQLVRRQFFQES